MTTRKCLAAQKSICICDCHCISCGVSKHNVSEECQLCMDCEKDQLKKANIPTIYDLKNSIVVKEENPAVIFLNGD